MDRYQAREIVLKDVSLSPGARLLYLLLDNYQREQAECWPCQKTLQRELKCSPRSLCRWLAELIRGGLCVASRRGYGMSNSYVLHWCHERHDYDATGGTSVMPRVARHKANQALKPEIHKTLRAETQKTACGVCGDTGWELVERVCRGIGVQGYRLCICRGGEARRSA